MKNKKQAEISLFWDTSHIWGLLVWHSLRSLGIAFNPVSAHDIKQGLNSHLLLVPGGSARMKSRALGEEGANAIRSFVERGGKYLGFCGGAGLALSTHTGLGLCPWQRSSINDKLLHHISGSLHVEPAQHPLLPSNYQEETILPVWFPARFDTQCKTIKKDCQSKPTVLAKYIKPSADLFMSDLPLALFEKDYNEESQDLYGTYLDPKLTNEPCSILGSYGKGEYILSYAHLETPDSTYANLFYFNILTEFAKISKIEASAVPQLDLNALPCLWDDRILNASRIKLENLLQLGLDLELFFYRNPWLYGWKHGLQGIQIANLRLALCLLQNTPVNDLMQKKWKEKKNDFEQLFNLFFEGSRSLLYSRRLCLSVPDSISAHLLSDQQSRLFGKVMEVGGICGELITILEDIFILQDRI